MRVARSFRDLRRAVVARAGTFGSVSSLAGAAVTATLVLDLISGSINLSTWWTVFSAFLTLTVCGLPLALGRAFRPWMALIALWIFAVVTIVQVAAATDTVMAINNLVLYPMFCSYLGWFFNRGIARWTVALLLVGSATAVISRAPADTFTTWANLAIASVFCLEASGYLRHRLDDRIETDPLTGALNRAGWARVCRQSMNDSLRRGEPLTVALIDFDDFKTINDTAGHAAGDRALVDFVASVRSQQRFTDRIARLGGDEFGLVVAGADPGRVAHRLERLRSKSTTSWSFGLAQAAPDDTVESVVERADRQLYAMKRLRR